MDEATARRLEERRRRRKNKPKKQLQLDAVKIVARPDQLVLGPQEPANLESTARAADWVLENGGLDLDLEYLSQDPVLMGEMEQQQLPMAEEEEKKEAAEEPPDATSTRADLALQTKAMASTPQAEFDPQSPAKSAESRSFSNGSANGAEGEAQGEQKNEKEQSHQPQAPEETQKPPEQHDSSPKQQTHRKKSAMKSALKSAVQRKAISPPVADPPLPRPATKEPLLSQPATIVTLSTRELQQDWDIFFEALLLYKECNQGSCRVSPDNPHLAEWVQSLREKRRTNALSGSQIAALDEIGFVWDADGPSTTGARSTVATGESVGIMNVPTQPAAAATTTTPLHAAESATANTARVVATALARPKYPLPTIKVICKNAAWQKSWDDNFAALLEFRDKNDGSCSVPFAYKVNPKLARWVGKCREQYRENKLAKDKIAALEEIGLIWRIKAAAPTARPSHENRGGKDPWDPFLEQLETYRQIYGNVKVPSKFPENQALANWLRGKRDKFASHRQDRQRKLLEVGVLPQPSQLKLLSAEMTAVLEKVQSTNRVRQSNGGNDDSQSHADEKMNITDSGHRHTPSQGRAMDGPGAWESDSETETESEDDLSARPASGQVSLSYHYDYDNLSHSSSESSFHEWTSTKATFQASLLDRIEQNIDKEEENLVLRQIGENISNRQETHSPELQSANDTSRHDEGDNERVEEDNIRHHEGDIENLQEGLQQSENNGDRDYPTSPAEKVTTGRQPVADHRPPERTLTETTSTSQTRLQDHGCMNDPIMLDDSSDEDYSVDLPPVESRKGRKRKLGPPIIAPKRVNATLIVPKYLGAGGDPSKQAQKPFLTQSILDGGLVVPFLIQNCKSSASVSAADSFKAELQEVASDSTSYRLSMTGTVILVKAFRLYFEQWLRRQCWQHAFRDLLTDRLRIELDVSLPRVIFLDAWTRGSIREVSDNTSRSALWVNFVEYNDIAKSFLEPLLGEDIMKKPTLAVAILKVENVAYRKDEWNEARKRFLQLETSNIDVSLCIGGYGTLDGLNKSIIDGDIRKFDEVALPPEIQAGSQMDVSSINHSVTSRRNSHLSEKTQPDSLKTATAYQQFYTKYKSIYDFDYQRSVIGCKHVMSEMWKQHKFRYGMACEDRCQCAKDIHFLCTTVIESFISKQTLKDPEWQISNEWSGGRYSPVGFVNHFGKSIWSASATSI